MNQKGNAVHSVRSENAPRPAGHYNQAVVHHGIVYCAGQLPLDPKSGELVKGPFEAQAQAALANLAAVLAAAGSHIKCSLKITVYLARIEDWQTFDDLFKVALGTHRPARTVIPVSGLHHGALIEIDAIATVL
jgi:reactive intermediate/imine deaminase